MAVVSDTVSPPARDLYWSMADRADKRSLHVPLEQVLVISIERKREGKDPGATSEISELVEADWIGEASDGGWNLSPSSD